MSQSWAHIEGLLKGLEVPYEVTKTDRTTVVTYVAPTSYRLLNDDDTLVRMPDAEVKLTFNIAGMLSRISHSGKVDMDKKERKK